MPILNSSELVRRFSTRLGLSGLDPLTAMSAAIVGLRQRRRPTRIPIELGQFFPARRVATVEYISGLGCDGLLQPCGISFDDGFRLVVKAGVPDARIRFTIAHELCHTFFYEIVPELKFCPHEIDPDEERLCNAGAAELLMPTGTLKKDARRSGISLGSLESLATLYRVSVEAMFLRVRTLKLCNSELSVWRRMSGGGFALHRLLGGRRVEWSWMDSTLLSKAWTTGQVLSGRTYLEIRDGNGCLQVRPVSYQISRRRDSLIALWSEPSRFPMIRTTPLFEVASTVGKG